MIDGSFSNARWRAVPTDVMRGFLAYSQDDLEYWLRARDDLLSRLAGATKMIDTRKNEVEEYTAELEGRGEL